MSALAPRCRHSDIPVSNDAPGIRHDVPSVWGHDDCALSAPVQGPAGPLPVITNDDLVALRVRVIALENILIAVLAEGSEAQRQTARDMSDVLSTPRDVWSDPLTIRAAHHMVGVIHRACHARDVTL